MTPEEPAGIDNGIRLCANHGRQVDTDEVTFTVEKLHRLKDDHERRCQLALGASASASAGRQTPYLVAVGPQIVGVGDLDRAQGHDWRIRIEHFVSRSFANLGRLSGVLPTIPAYDRYLAINSLGEGRSLVGGFTVERRDGHVIVDCKVAPSFLRTPADKLPTDWALSAEHDLTIGGGTIATVSGLAALHPGHSR